ncbi:MAG: hypothetical protein K6T88_02655 [Bacillus sp. (in: Bacteria)]|nr:hypothetical protein [Bacillus sp. (in: firmicutes)]
MKKVALVIGLVIVGAGIFSIKYFTMFFDAKDSAIVVNHSYTYEDDYRDKRKLASAVDNIFIGEVVTDVGNKEYTGHPNTQYKIMIIQNIKGALLGDITVNQEGGYYKKNGKLKLFTYEKSPLLIKKQVYLFAVSATEKDYFHMIPKYGYYPLDNEEQKYKLIASFNSALEK